MKIEWVQAYPTDRYEYLATHPKGAPPPREASAISWGKWSQIYVKFEIQGLFNNIQVGFDGHHKKLIESIRSTKLEFVERVLMDKWMKTLKNNTKLVDRT